MHVHINSVHSDFVRRSFFSFSSLFFVHLFAWFIVFYACICITSFLSPPVHHHFRAQCNFSRCTKQITKARKVNRKVTHFKMNFCIFLFVCGGRKKTCVPICKCIVGALRKNMNYFQRDRKKRRIFIA